MSEELDKIKTKIDNVFGADPPNKLKYDGPSVAGLTPSQAKLKGKPCKAMRWIRDNSNFRVEIYIKLTERRGTQGIRIFNKNTDKLIEDLSVPMGGGDYGSVETQIYENTKTILAEAVKFIHSGGGSLQDFKALLKGKISTGKTNPIGYIGGGLEGIEGIRGISKSPCKALAWLNTNSPFRFISYARLTDTGGYQGFVVNRPGQEPRIIESPIPNLDRDDPKKQIYRANMKFILKAVKVVARKIQNGGF